MPTLTLDDNQSIFARGVALMEGIFYTGVERYPTYWYLPSVFSEAWYNLIVPTVSYAQVDWNAIRHRIDQEQERDISIYLADHLAGSYEPILMGEQWEHGGVDAYLVKEVTAESAQAGEDWIVVDDAWYDRYLTAVTACFPHYDSASYCRFYHDISRMHNPTDSHLSNYNMIKLRNDEVIAFGSILVSSQIGLGYLHNMGTAAAHRHQGHFLDCITQLTEKAEQHGVDTVYAQAEQGEASYHGFLKAGFTQDETYQMWYNR